MPKQVLSVRIFLVVILIFISMFVVDVMMDINKITYFAEYMRFQPHKLLICKCTEY